MPRRWMLGSLKMLGLALLLAAPGFALPVYQASAGNDPAQRLLVSLTGNETTIANYTIGLIHRNLMTAGVDDPDFQVQALQADHVTLLHEYGRAVEREFSFNFNPEDLGVFILRNASLRDFSLGRNLYRPVFSVPGAPESHLSTIDFLKGGSLTIVDFQLGGSGVVRGSGAGLLGGETIGLSIQDRWAQLDETPVVPEPATLGLVALGLGVIAARRRRA